MSKQRELKLDQLENAYELLAELDKREGARVFSGKRREDGHDVLIVVARKVDQTERTRGSALDLFAADVKLLGSLEHRALVPIFEGRWIEPDGFAVISDVFKLLVYDLCRHVNEVAGREVVPESVITKPPSAELRPDQRDDQSLPPYEVLDPLLELYVERDLTASEVVAAGFDPALVARVVRLVDLAEYKRRQGPPGPRITPKAFGKDRRVPITNHYGR